MKKAHIDFSCKLQKPLAEVINGGAAAGVSRVVARKGAAQKKAHDQQQKPKKVIVISPDEELKSEGEKPIVSARKSGKGSSRKTLTSILTARSKVISSSDIYSLIILFRQILCVAQSCRLFLT